MNKNYSHSIIKNVSKREAAEMLGVSVRTIENLIYNRAIDHVRIRGRVLISVAAIVRYNESCTIKAREHYRDKVA